MDAFDKTVQKVKEVFNTACEKTGEVVNVQKLKIDLATLKSKLTKAYAKLGKIEYKKLKDSVIDDIQLKGAIAEINTLNDEILKLKETIDNLQGKITCSACGTRVPNDAEFCIRCGAKLNNEDSKSAEK